MNMTKEDDTLDLRRDGIDMDTFWNKQGGQEVYNGRFLTDAEIKTIKTKTDIYKKLTIEKWQKLLERMK